MRRAWRGAGHGPGGGASGTLSRRAWGRRGLTRRPAAVQPAAVVPPRGTGALAGAAGQAAVQVQARLLGRLGTLKNLLHEIDAAAGPVQLIPQDLVGRTGGGTEAAMDALAEDFLGLAAVRRVFDEIGELGLHGDQNSG